MAYTDDAYKWARLTLFGDSTATDISDASLALFVASAERDLCLAYPCVSGNGKTNTLTDSTDLANFAEALGYEVATRFLRTPAGRTSITTGHTVKIGPVIDVTPPNDVSVDKIMLTADSVRAMMRITCVNTAIVAANQDDSTSAKMFGLAGRRRTVY